MYLYIDYYHVMYQLDKEEIKKRVVGLKIREMSVSALNLSKIERNSCICRF